MHRHVQHAAVEGGRTGLSVILPGWNRGRGPMWWMPIAAAIATEWTPLWALLGLMVA